MSWNINFVGRPELVALKVKTEMSKNPCAEPEETIRQGVGKIVQLALEGMPRESAVRVEASGSQSMIGDEARSNQVSLKIEPIYGFLQ